MENRVQDARWISGLKAGEFQAFDAVYAAYKDRVYGYACSLAGVGATAEDLVQEAFLGLLRRLEDVDRDRALLPYLLASVRHRFEDRRRSPALRRAAASMDVEAVADDAGPLAAALDEERGRLVRAALEELPEAQGDVVRMRVFGQLGTAAIADALGAPVATVRNRWRAALERLRTRLTRTIGDG